MIGDHARWLGLEGVLARLAPDRAGRILQPPAAAVHDLIDPHPEKKPAPQHEPALWVVPGRRHQHLPRCLGAKLIPPTLGHDRMAARRGRNRGARLRIPEPKEACPCIPNRTRQGALGAPILLQCRVPGPPVVCIHLVRGAVAKLLQHGRHAALPLPRRLRLMPLHLHKPLQLDADPLTQRPGIQRLPDRLKLTRPRQPRPQLSTPAAALAPAGSADL